MSVYLDFLQLARISKLDSVGIKLPFAAETTKVGFGPVTALVEPPAFAVPCQKCSVDHQPASPQPEAERCVGNQSKAT